MTKRSAHHSTFVIERAYPFPPSRVFAAFADPKIKALWFKGPDEWDNNGMKMDFRVGGQDHESGGPKGEPAHTYNATYYDIVPNERIVTAYSMHLGDALMSVSVATAEFKAEGAGTKLIYTEQGAYLDGDGPADAAGREEGTRELLASVESALRATA
jgi:uncharacterized protein YndB with AHSA1/START domain